MHTSYSHRLFTPDLTTCEIVISLTPPVPPVIPVVAPPSSVVKCLWEVFLWGFGVLFSSCVCVCRGCCSLSVYVGM